MKIFITGYKLF